MLRPNRPRFAGSLHNSRHYYEAISILRRTLPVARRVLGEDDAYTLRLRHAYAAVLCSDGGGSLDDLREGINMFMDTERIARRVLGGAHPFVADIEDALRKVRAILHAREASSSGTG